MTDEAISKYMRTMGAKGGKATAKALSPQRRKAIATKAAKTRWKRVKRLAKGLK
jgi:hypothetical protein